MKIVLLHKNKAEIEINVFAFQIILTKKLSLLFAIQRPMSFKQFKEKWLK